MNMQYEVHVTTDPCYDAAMDKICETHRCHTSIIDKDEEMDIDYLLYWTFRAETYEEAYRRMNDLCNDLPVPILRKKIEHIVYDVRQK